MAGGRRTCLPAVAGLLAIFLTGAATGMAAMGTAAAQTVPGLAGVAGVARVAGLGGSDRATEVLCRATATCRATLIVRLAAAPFPYDADPNRREPAFFDGRTTATGERIRTRAGHRFEAGRHYSDNRVLIHIPPGFDPSRPMVFLIFFHGHRATLRRDVVGRYAIPAQVSAARRNVILIAPQLAHDALDSHPGKLTRQNGLADLMAEAAGVVARETGVNRARLARAPIILSAFSGGNVAVISSLEKGGVGGRVAGVILLDALYGEVGRYAAWFARNDQKAFLAVVFGPSTAGNTDKLITRFRDRGVPFTLRLPSGEFGGDDNVFLRVETPHLRIPLDGPPVHPIASILRRLPAFEIFAPVAPNG